MVVLPQQIEKYLSTNLDQPYVEWTSTGTYTIATKVLYKNYIYQSIVDENNNIQPDLNTGKWLLMGVDNSYSAIDLNSSTTTLIDDDEATIELSFASVGFTYLAFGGVQGGVLTVNEYDSTGALLKTKDYTIGLVRVNANNWYNYYYLPIPDSTGAGSGLEIDILIDLIQPTTARIDISLTRSSVGEAYISSMVGGIGTNIGATEFGVKISIVDYSIKETDPFGITTLERRKSRELMDCDIVLPAQYAQGAKRYIKTVLGTSLMFIADPEADSKFDNLLTLGYVDAYEVYFNNGVISRARIKLEEVL